VLFPFQSDQERKEENEDDLEGIGWQPAVEVHSGLRLLKTPQVGDGRA
jgi:hypothetical protein